MRINKKILAIIMICGAMFLTMGYFKSENMISASASNNIRKLKENKEYNIDLDKDGTDEIVKYTLKDTGNDESTYKIVINGKVMCQKKGIYCAYNPGLLIMDIDKNDGVLDMWAYSMGESSDIMYSALYEYSSGKIKKLLEIKEQYSGIKPGIIGKIKQDGKFYVAMDRVFRIDNIVGNHYDYIPYQLKNGKVKRIKTKTYEIAHIFNKDSLLKAKEKIIFYRDKSKKLSKAFTLKKGEKVKPLKIYKNGKKLLIQFENSKGKKGWIDTKKYNNKQIFSNIKLFD